MKKTLSIFVLSLICTMVAALPVEWDLFTYSAAESTETVNLKLKNDYLLLPGGEKTKSVKIKSDNNFFDFDKLVKNHNHAIIRTTFECPAERQTYLGVGGLSFALELNGKQIYDFRRKGLGNDYDPVSNQDHIIPVTFKKGKNTIVVRSCRTNWLLDFCYGADRRIKWNLTIAEHQNYQPVKAELAYREVLLRPTENSVVFSFITKSPVHAGIDYREAGSAKWQRQWDLAGELVVRNDKKNHIMRLENLKSATTYEYRIVLLEPDFKGGEKRSLWGNRPHKEVFMPIREFRTPGGDEINFFVLCDTQLSLSTTCRTVADREKILSKMRKLPEFKNSDFVVHDGDMTSYFHNIEKDLFGDFFEQFAADKMQKQWIYVRGNHELDGIDAVKWHDFFVMNDEKPYYSFKIKDTLFIVLACGDFVKGKYNAFIGPILDPAAMVEKQRQWVENLTKSDDFKNAKFRIVLSHIAPQIEKSQVIDEIRKIAAPIMNDSIHFWIAGHCHYYWRMFKNSDILYAREQYPKAPEFKTAKFNWITLDGPKSSSAYPDFSYLSVNIKNDKITAKIVDQDGRLMDSFIIDSKGNAVELKRSANIKPFTFTDK